MDANSATTGSEQLQAFRAQLSELTQPRDFGITLICPECGSPSLRDYVFQRCPDAAGKAQGKSVALFEAGGVLITILLGMAGLGGMVALTVIGGMMGGPTGRIAGLLIGLGMAKMEMVDLRRSLAKGRGARTTPALSLAHRYALNPETYNQAASLYYNWATTINPIQDPGGFISFLRCYRCSKTANPEMRDALFNAVLAKAVAQLNKSDADLKSLLDASFTGSSVQRTTLRLITAWKDSVEDSTFSIKPLIREIEESHAKGVDTQGHQLRLPSGYALVRQIEHGLSFTQAVGSELIEAATTSGPFLAEASNALKHTNWPDRQRIAAKIRADNAPFAQVLAGAVKSDTMGIGCLFSASFFLIPFTLSAFDSLWGGLTGGNFIWAAFGLMVPGSFVYLVLRTRRRRRIITGLLSGM